MQYYSLNTYLKETFGEKVYKLSLALATTCPNRDGTLGYGGCIFCGEKGAGEFAAGPNNSVADQIAQAKERIAAKTDARKFIAYFQSFTGTYLPLDVMRGAFMQAAKTDDVCIVSVATRPDCLGPEVVRLLAEISRIKPVWVELGLQTANENTAAYIRRGYPLAVYDDAVRRLHEAGLSVVTHMILGLPSETKQDMLHTAAQIARAKSDGIKLKSLYVLKGTDLEKDYAAGRFSVLTKEAYIDILTDIIDILPEGMVIHRLTGDGDRKMLVAPAWSADKKDVRNSIQRAMIRKNTLQGRKWPEIK
jgi:radical SAM protein (TIGR01212 family)